MYSLRRIMRFHTLGAAWAIDLLVTDEAASLRGGLGLEVTLA